MANVWGKHRGYSFCRHYVDWCTRTSYAPLKVEGLENIPTDGAVIFAANHCNTLMDALVVLQLRHSPTSFGARADIFRKPGIAALLTWLRILPVARLRDGLKEMERNNSRTFDAAVESVAHGVPFVLYPEGTHTTSHEVQRFKTGIVKIAALACERISTPVYIVPVGIDYKYFFRYAAPATVRIGESISCREKTDEDAHLFASEIRDRVCSLVRRPDMYEPDNQAVDPFKAVRPEKGCRILKAAAAVAILPVFLLSSIASLPMLIAAGIIGKKLKDRAWMNTVRYCCKFAGVILLALLVGIPLLFLTEWYFALAYIVAMAYSHPLFYICLNFYSDFFSKSA